MMRELAEMRLSAARARGASCSPRSATPGTRSRRSRSGASWWRAATRCACRRGRSGARTSSARGCGSQPAPEYQVVPDGRAAAQAVRGGGAGGAGDAAADPRAATRTSWWRTSSRSRRRWRRRWRGGRGPRSMPHVLPIGRAGLPALLGRRAAAAHAGRRARLWRLARPLLVRRRGARARGELNERAGAGGAAAARPRARRDLAPAGAGRHLPAARVPAPRVAGRAMRVTGPLLWEQPFGEVELPPGRRAARAGGAEHLAGPRAADAARGARGAGGRAGARARHHEPARPPARRCRCRRTRGVVDWLSYARTMPRCAAVVCHAGHGTVARALACGVPVVACPARGDMAENAARRAWAGVGVSLPRRLRHGARDQAGGAAAAGRAGLRGAARRAAATGRARHDGAAIAAEAVEACGYRRARAKLRGWDSNPQPSVNSRCSAIELPRTYLIGGNRLSQLPRHGSTLQKPRDSSV